MTEQLLFLITGAVTGTLAGLLGVGGGIIVVPILNSLFAAHFPSSLTMHMATGSSLAIMIFTSLSSTYAYQRRDLIDWTLFYRFTPGLLLGIAIGSVVSKHVSSHHLLVGFAIFMLIVAINMLFTKTVTAQRNLPGFLALSFYACLIGIFSGLFGIGGGSLMVPFFVYCQVEMHKAAGTSSLCGLPVAFAGTLLFILAGWAATSVDQVPSGTTGFVYWPAVILVAITSVIFAPLGTRLAVWLPAEKLKRVFATLLFITGLYLLKSN